MHSSKFSIRGTPFLGIRGVQTYTNMSLPLHSSFSKSDVQDINAWHDVLRLATEWEFASIRELAIERLRPIVSDIDKVVFGHAYEVDGWVMPGYMALVERENPITAEEGKRLGIEDMAAIAAAREEVQAAMAPAERSGISQVPSGFDGEGRDFGGGAISDGDIAAERTSVGSISPMMRKQPLSDLRRRVQAHIPRSTIIYRSLPSSPSTETSEPPLPVDFAPIPPGSHTRRHAPTSFPPSSPRDDPDAHTTGSHSGMEQVLQRNDHELLEDGSVKSPSALATPRIIEGLNEISYPEGVKRPKVEFNANDAKGKFRYVCYVLYSQTLS